MILLRDFSVAQCCGNPRVVICPRQQHTETPQMKKIIALVLATAMVAGAAAPSFAATADHCAFKDQTLCVTQSLVDVNNG
jgi:hypothetical protein